MKRKYWHIVGYRSLKKIYERKVKFGCFSDAQMERLLMTLAAKAGLDFDEIVGAYARKGTKVAKPLLEIQRDYRHGQVSCGINPYFVAKVVVE